MSTPTNTIIHVRLPCATYDAIRETAAAEDRAISAVAKRALIERFTPTSRPVGRDPGVTESGRPFRPVSKSESAR